jgi:hypothetical protein
VTYNADRTLPRGLSSGQGVAFAGTVGERLSAEISGSMTAICGGGDSTPRVRGRRAMVVALERCGPCRWARPARSHGLHGTRAASGRCCGARPEEIGITLNSSCLMHP